MIDTCNTKPAHYTHGFYSVGSGPETILLLGSCRIMPFANYFNRINTDNRFTICVIYVVNYTEDAAGNPTDCEAQIDRLRDNPGFMDMVKRCKWFIHEHIENYGYLNTSANSQKNIFQLGLQPELDITIPNFNDVFILHNDWIDCGVPVPENYIQSGEKAVEKFCQLCALSSFPEFGDYFRSNWREARLFWRPNHSSREFTLHVFRLMNDKFLHLSLTNEFWTGAATEDLFRNPHTLITEQDINGYQLRWPLPDAP